MPAGKKPQLKVTATDAVSDVRLELERSDSGYALHADWVDDYPDGACDPVEQVRRIYTIEDVKRSARLRGMQVRGHPLPRRRDHGASIGRRAGSELIGDKNEFRNR